MYYQGVLEDNRQQIELMNSLSESARQATYESMRQIELMNSFSEEARRETELMLSVVNKVLESSTLEKTKSTILNVSYYCRKWNWELYVLTDPL